MPPKFSKELKQSVIFATEPLENQPRTSPCEVNCPAGHAIQRTIYLIQNERFEEALENVRAKNPFTGICGRICFHPCETECNRSLYEQGISIRALERAASSLGNSMKVKNPEVREKKGKKIAIVGAGPAGMTCASFLTLFGHDVTVYEALPILGGMPRIGVPDYRLPKDIVDREIGEILERGVRARMNTRVGRDISFQKLRNEYDACLVATGVWKDRKLEIPGSSLAISGLSFLTQVQRGEHPEIGKRLVILGGGGVAFDCACTARRLGAQEVHVVCPEPRDAMLAYPEDIEQGIEDGVIIHNLEVATKILSEKKLLTGVECLKIRSFAFDEKGKLSVDAVPGSEHVFPADTVLVAIGQVPDFGFLEGAGSYRFTKRGTLEVDPNTQATSVKGVFAAGDAVNGPSSVAEAIGSGRRAAISMDCYLIDKPLYEIDSIYLDPQKNITIQKYDSKGKRINSSHIVQYHEVLNTPYYEKKPRMAMKRLPPADSINGFEEIYQGYVKQEAVEEAKRCFHCGHCSMCGTCVEVCPLDVLVMGEEGPEVAYPDECWHCGNCRINCPCGAVYYEFPLSMLI